MFILGNQSLLRVPQLLLLLHRVLKCILVRNLHQGLTLTDRLLQKLLRLDRPLLRKLNLLLLLLENSLAFGLGLPLLLLHLLPLGFLLLRSERLL